MIFEKQVIARFRSQVFSRADDTGAVRYFAPEDFPSLTVTPYPFPAKEGHRLCGYFYTCGEYSDDRVVIFDHGMGGGHRSYLREIVMLAKSGFRVFAYDHTGCMTSEGETTGGFLQSLADLDSALTALKKDPALGDVRFSVVGHSWGGFAALNIAALHPDVTHVVAMAGFRSAEAIVRSIFKGPLALYRRAILAQIAAPHPELMHHDAVKTLADTDARVLIIHSQDDRTVSFQEHFKVMERALAGRENIRFLPLSGRGHNPNYTEDAAAYLASFLHALKARIKKGGLVDREAHRAFLAEFDWYRMTEQDEEVFKAIRAHLNS